MQTTSTRGTKPTYASKTWLLLMPALVIAISEIERNCRLEKHHLLVNYFALCRLSCVCQHPHSLSCHNTGNKTRCWPWPLQHLLEASSPVLVGGTQRTWNLDIKFQSRRCRVQPHQVQSLHHLGKILPITLLFWCHKWDLERKINFVTYHAAQI